MRIDVLDKVFSKYIRLRDSKPYGFKAFKCISCGRVLSIEQADAGHFVKRSNMATRFNEMNVHAQCISCNRFHDGNYEEFRKNLEDKFGVQKMAHLLQLGHCTVKYSNSDIEEMIKYYRKKIKELETEQ